ncbi:hypothetical protein Tco_0091690 [Tanacetum coccineum]
MGDPNITMEEYSKLQAEKAQRHGRMFNWEITTYGKVYCDNLEFFTDFEADFPSIVYNDALTSNQNVSSEPTVSIYNAIKIDFDFSITFSDFDDEVYTFICDKNSFSYKLILVDDLKPEHHVEINTELCLENIDIKPMDSVDTTPVESDEHSKTNHDEKSELLEMSNFILIIKMINRISFNERKPLILLIKNQYVPFGIPFDPKRFYKDGVYMRRLRRPRRTGKKKLCKADLEGPAFNLVKAFHKNSVFLQYQMDECHKLLTNKIDLSNPEGHQILRNIYEPLPLGGPPGQSPQIEKYVRSQMRILSVISVKVFEKYGYNYLREIILRRADYQEYKISEKILESSIQNELKILYPTQYSRKLTHHCPKTEKTRLHA